MYDYCSVGASRLLRNDKISRRVTVLLNETLTNEEVDAELAKVIKNRWSKDSDRINAIKEYNKLRQRIVDRNDHTSGGKPISISFDPIFNAVTRETTTDHSQPSTL